jgi:hypothetical protein
VRSLRFLALLAAVLLAACSLFRQAPQDGGRFYTWVDAEGRLHTQALAAPAAAPAPVATAASGAAPALAPAVPATAKGAKAAEERPDLFAPDAEFVDSTVLESHHFNMENKKKFGMITDASGRSFPVYYARGEGIQDNEDAVPAPVPANQAQAVEQGGVTWPLPVQCCAALLGATGAPELMQFRHPYHLQVPLASCVSDGACKPPLLGLPKQGKARALRLYSYINSVHCKSCLQWPLIVVLDKKFQPRRAYVADLGGYKPESWYGFASFHFDFDISGADDAYLMLVQSNRALSYKNKRYQGSDKGEIAFALIP